MQAPLLTTNAPLLWDGIWHSRDGEAHVIPQAWAVCPACGGEGTEVNPAVDGFSANDIHPCDREDFFEGYFAGRYDQKCQTCSGRTTVKGYDLSVLAPHYLAEYEADHLDYLREQAADAAERRFTGGY